MYNPPAFRVSDPALVKDLMRRHSFAAIVGVADGAARLAYAPTLYLPDGQDGRIQFHLARNNPLAAIDEGTVLTLTFLGPHAYISPNWYKSTDQVPTWNYIAVEAVGRVRCLNSEELKRQLEALVAQHESQISSAVPWTLANLAGDQLANLLNAIKGFE